MPTLRSIYSFFLSTLGIILIVWSLVEISHGDSLLTFALLLILAVLVQTTMTYVIRGTSGVSVETAIGLASIPLFGFHAAILIAAAAAFSAWALSLRVDNPPWRHAVERLGVNVGMYSISIFLAGIAFEWSLGWFSDSSVWQDTIPWLLAAVAADQLNLWLLIGIIYLAHGVRPLDTWRENLWAVPINVLVMAVGGGVLAYAVRQIGALGIIVFFLPIILSAYAYRYIVWKTKRQMEELEELVSLRTQALANANDELMDLQKEKDAFLAVLTHDMRTPLTSIQGYASILSTQPLSAEQRSHMAKVILRNGETLLDIVNNMLEIEQMKTTASLVLECSKFDLMQVVDRALEATQTQAMDKSIELKCDLLDVPLFVYADEKKIERILLNLASNAIKYTPREGHVMVTAKANGRYAIVDVIDDGYGIPEDELPYIFESYRRVQGHKQIAVGTGLGLAIVKSLIEAHGGQISVQSQIDVGSTFSIKIPLAAQELLN